MVILSRPESGPCKNQAKLTKTQVWVALIDHPGSLRSGCQVNEPEYCRISDDGKLLECKPLVFCDAPATAAPKGPASADGEQPQDAAPAASEGGSKKKKAKLRLEIPDAPWVKLARGTPFQITIFKALPMCVSPDSSQRLLTVGDTMRACSVTTKQDAKWGISFEPQKLDWEPGCVAGAQGAAHLSATLLSYVPLAQAPFVPVEKRPDYVPAAVNIPGLPAGARVVPDERTIKDVPGEQSKYLTDASNKWLWGPGKAVFVPIHGRNPYVMRWHADLPASVEPGFVYWDSIASAIAGMDMRAKENFSWTKKLEDNKTETIARYTFRREAYVISKSPQDGPVRRSAVQVTCTIWPSTLRMYGVESAAEQYTVLPQLFFSTPSVLACYAKGTESASKTVGCRQALKAQIARGDPVSCDDAFAMEVSPSSQSFPSKTWAPSAMPDLAAGIVSAGFEIDHATVRAHVEYLAKRNPPTVKGAAPRYAMDMTRSGDYPTVKANVLNTLESPIVNVLECKRDLNEMPDDEYAYYVVCNWWLKMPSYRPKLIAEHQKMYAEMSDAARRQEVGKQFLACASGKEPSRWQFAAAESEEEAVRQGAADRTKFAYLIYAVRRDALRARKIERYAGCDAYDDVLCKAEQHMEPKKEEKKQEPKKEQEEEQQHQEAPKTQEVADEELPDAPPPAADDESSQASSAAAKSKPKKGTGKKKTGKPLRKAKKEQQQDDDEIPLPPEEDD